MDDEPPEPGADAAIDALPREGECRLAPWEYTLGELFSDAGHATRAVGKWHVGESEARLPTDQGFDEWFGIKNTSITQQGLRFAVEVNQRARRADAITERVARRLLRCRARVEPPPPAMDAP